MKAQGQGSLKPMAGLTNLCSLTIDVMHPFTERALEPLQAGLTTLVTIPRT